MASNDVSYPPPGHSDMPNIDKEALLFEALNTILDLYPPKDQYGSEVRGCFSGPTSLAYLFFHVSKQRPDLIIHKEPAIYWAKAYLKGQRNVLEFEVNSRCGVSSEALAYPAICAVVNIDLASVERFASLLSEIFATNTESEWHSGRAGALYLARAVTFWLPESAPLLHDFIARLRASLINDGPDWSFRGKSYLGAAHGSIGIITQIALSSPEPEELKTLEKWIDDLLKLQQDDGNWFGTISEDRDLIQVCHGAPGYVQGLSCTRSLFPALHHDIDRAILKAQPLIQNRLILKKEPNLCHGLFGNALCVDKALRDKMLLHGLPNAIAAAREHDPRVFEKANYGVEDSLLTGYWPGAAWAYLVADQNDAKIIGFNDI